MIHESELHDWVLMSLVVLVYGLFWIKKTEYLKKSIEYKNQKELLDKWFNNSNDLHCTASLDGTFTFLSNSWAKATGYSLKELKSKPFINFVHPHDREKTAKEASLLFDANYSTIRFVNRYIRKDGTIMHLEWVAQSDGSQIHATARDISEYYKIEVDLKHWLLVGLELVATVNAARPDKWSFVSKGLQQLLGWPESELMNKPWKEIIELKEELKEELDDFTIITKAKTVTKTCSGDKVHLFWNITQDRQSGNIYMSASDTTEYVIQQQYLKSMIRELEQANIALSSFANVAAHQLRSSPRSILGAAQIIEEDFKLPDGVQEYINDIKQDAILMSDIVDGLHKISDIRKLKNIKAVPIDLNVTFKPIVSSYCKDFSDCYIKVCPDLPIVIGDQTLLTEAFSNLVENGLKFNKSILPVVKIYSTTDIPNRTTTITVEDNGIGINPEYHKKLFSLFERLTTEFPGTGVGLYLTKMIVERLHGTIKLESELNKGSKFYVTLPLYIKGSSV